MRVILALPHALGIPADTHDTDLSGKLARVVPGEPVLGLFG
jgi:hypothetical protein